MYYYRYMTDTFAKTFPNSGHRMIAESFAWLRSISVSAKVIALRAFKTGKAAAKVKASIRAKRPAQANTHG